MSGKEFDLFWELSPRDGPILGLHLRRQVLFGMVLGTQGELN